MGYLRNFEERVAQNDYPGFLRIWEEYCYSDEINSDELIQILEIAKNSSLAAPFGRHVERILPLWRDLPEGEKSFEALKLIYDIQTTNSEELAELACSYLKGKYPNDPAFEDKLRLVGLRTREHFPGALRNFELLCHFEKGKFVYHKAGWGTGEILDVSSTREELTLEFDMVPGKKHLSFLNAFKTLLPLSDDHFFTRRFGNPDLLEQQARENPVEVIALLLRDLGPKTAAEIKNELSDLVIPSADWTRWWQQTKAKVKKDVRIRSPEGDSSYFSIRKEEISYDRSFFEALNHKSTAAEVIPFVYSFLKDFPEMLKNEGFKEILRSKLEVLLPSTPSFAEQLQLHFFLEDLSWEPYTLGQDLVRTITDVEPLLEGIEILAFKKKTLVLIKACHKDWEKIFFSVLFSISQNFIRDYLFDELNDDAHKEKLKKSIQDLLSNPLPYPYLFFWYFQKIFAQPDSSSLPFSDVKGRKRFFEEFLILASHLAQKPETLDLAKKMLALILKNRFLAIREVFQQASLSEVKEFLLLFSKCQFLDAHDQKIIQSLAEVVYPSLAKGKKKNEEEQFIWSTQKGYEFAQKKMEQISTKEMIENAREIEEARSHGDLRENAEYKAALEKRSHLQEELRALAGQINLVRVLSKEDISTDKVGVGTIVTCQTDKGEQTSFVFLGPWEANSEKNILSYQSKLAQTMFGLKKGESFQFQKDRFTIVDIQSYL